jgi:WD40 repeat protein
LSTSIHNIPFSSFPSSSIVELLPEVEHEDHNENKKRKEGNEPKKPKQIQKQEIQEIHEERKIKMEKMIGNRGQCAHHLFWSQREAQLIYSCEGAVIAESVPLKSQKVMNMNCGIISCVAVDSNGKLLAAAATSKEIEGYSDIYMWTCSGSLHVKEPLQYHRHKVQDMSFSKEGTFLVSIGNFFEKTAVVWSVETGS